MSPAPHPRMHGISHVTGGPDPIPGLLPSLGGDTLDSVIAALDPAGWWKLNEDSGSVAADSSGNGNDMTTGSYDDPLWAQPAGPPGEQTANMETGTSGIGGTASRVAVDWTVLDTSFTAGLFYQRNTTGYTPLMGQGNPDRAGSKGWELANWSAAHGDPDTNRPTFRMAGANYVSATNPLGVDEWVLIAGVYDETVPEMRLYVNGLLQVAAESATGYVPVNNASPDRDLWIGHDAGLGGNAIYLPRFHGSYAFLIPSALTSTELLDIWNRAGSPGFVGEGDVLTSNGAGGSSWEPPTIEVDNGTVDRYSRLTLGTGLTGTDNTDGSITIAAAPVDATQVWMPLTTVSAGVPELVWDGDDQLIPTLTDL